MRSYLAGFREAPALKARVKEKVRSEQDAKRAKQAARIDAGSNGQEPSKELVVSASEFADEFLNAALKGVEEAAIDQRRVAIDDQIKDHYYERAKGLYRQVWRQCRALTGHQYRNTYNGNSNLKWLVCNHCGHPSGDGVKTRMRTGINELARRLREADRQAGIEFIP